MKRLRKSAATMALNSSLCFSIIDGCKDRHDGPPSTPTYSNNGKTYQPFSQCTTVNDRCASS